MMICGLEAPLDVNEQLDELDEETGKLTLSHTRHESLNRYTFGWLGGGGEADRAFAKLVYALQQQIGRPAIWLSTWTANAGEVDTTLQRARSIRSSWLVSKRRKEGWSVHETEGLSVALRPVGFLQPDGFRIEGFSAPLEGRLLVFGESVGPDLYVSSDALGSLKHLAARGKMAPSEQFLTWLAAHEITVCYRLDDERGYVFLVVITPHRLDIDDLVERGLVDKVKQGAEASLVWRSVLAL